MEKVLGILVIRTAAGVTSPSGLLPPEEHERQTLGRGVARKGAPSTAGGDARRCSRRAEPVQTPQKLQQKCQVTQQAPPGHASGESKTSSRR